MRLSHKDFDLFQQTVSELYEYRDLTRFRQEVPAILTKLIPADYSVWIEYAINPLAHRQTLADFVESSPCLTPKLTQQVANDIMKHPFTQYFIQGGEQTALKVSDFLTQTQFLNSELYSLVYRDWGFKYNLCVPVTSHAGNTSGLGINDNKKDFTERDRFLLNSFAPHFNQAHRNARLATTQIASAAKPLEAYDLTSREMDIAYWIARGKSNPEIAIILHCSARTIEKHVEKILEKLGVENRVAAAVTIVQCRNHPSR